MSKKKEEHGYWKTLGLAAPAFGAKALVADLPKGAIESAVEGKLRGSKAPASKLLTEGLKGRGVGRAIGGAAGIATAPIFLKGLSKLDSEERSEQLKGLGLLGGSAAGFGVLKGTAEGAVQAKQTGKSLAKALRQGAKLGITRSSYKTPGAVLMGLSIAGGRKKGKEESKYVMPAVTGAGLGAAARGYEDAALRMAKGQRLAKAVRGALPAAGGGAAAGVLGGLVFAGAVDQAKKALKGKKKEAGLGAEIIRRSAPLVSQAANTLGPAAADIGVLGLIHQGTKGALGKGAIGRVFQQTPGLRQVSAAAQEAEARQLAMGIREGLAGRTNIGMGNAFVLNFTVPELRVNREMGMQMGQALRAVPEQYRPEMLRRIAAKVQSEPGLLRTAQGDPVPILSSMNQGVAKALGDEPMYLGGHKAWDFAVNAGRGGYGTKGLPKAGFQDPKGGFHDVAPDIGQGLAAGAMLGSGIATANTPLTLAGAHGAIGAAKNLVPRTPGLQPLVQGAAGKLFAQGVRDTIMPGLPKSLGSQLTTGAIETLVSPASTDAARLGGALAGTALGKLGKIPVKKGATAVANKVMVPRKLEVGEALGIPAAAGVVAGATYGKLSKKEHKAGVRQGGLKVT